MNQILTFIGKFENDVPLHHGTIFHGYFLCLGGLELAILLMPDLNSIGAIGIGELVDREFPITACLREEGVLDLSLIHI